MYAQEHAPLVGNRRRQGGFLCHRGTSKVCTCGGDHTARKAERRMVKRAERQAVRAELASYF